MNILTNPEIIGQRIKLRRKELGISIAQIATLTDLTRPTVHRYENGDIKKIKLPTLEKLASILKVDLNWLIGDDDTPPLSVDTLEGMSFEGKDVVDLITNLGEYIIRTDELMFDNEPLSQLDKIHIVGCLEGILKLHRIIKTR